MNKPDFGVGTFYLTKWTPDRVAYLRYLADRGMSAAEISEDIYGTASRQQGISAQCRTRGIQLKGKAGRKPRAGHTMQTLVVEVSDRHLQAVAVLAAKCRLEPQVVVKQLVDAMFDQGASFLSNMMDLAADE